MQSGQTFVFLDREVPMEFILLIDTWTLKTEIYDDIF